MSAQSDFFHNRQSKFPREWDARKHTFASVGLSMSDIFHPHWGLDWLWSIPLIVGTVSDSRFRAQDGQLWR